MGEAVCSSVRVSVMADVPSRPGVLIMRKLAETASTTTGRHPGSRVAVCAQAVTAVHASTCPHMRHERMPGSSYSIIA